MANRFAMPARSAPTAALACLSAIVLLAALGTSIANVALPAIASALRCSFGQVQWVVVAYLLSVTSVAIIAGKLGDLFGRSRLMIAGLLLFALGSVLCAAAPSLALLIAARALQGIGAAVMMALALAMAREAAVPGREGRAIGLIAAMSAAGTALGPLAGGLLLATGGWRAVFLALVPVAASCLFAARLSLPRELGRRSARSAHFDTAGAALITVCVIAFALGVTLGPRFTAANFALLSTAAVTAAAFMFAERRSAFPLVPPGILGDRILGPAIIANVLVSAVMMSTLVIGPFYLARAIGLGPAGIGWAMSLGPFLVAISAVPAGRIADRIGGEPAGRYGLVLILGGCVTLSLAPPGLGFYLGPIAVVTLGYALFQTANNLVVMDGRPRSEGGAMSGLLNLSRNLGLIVGAAGIGAIFASSSGSADPSIAPAEAVAAGMRASFGVAAALVAATLMIKRVVSARSTAALSAAP